VQPPAGACWLEEMVRIFEADPKMAMLGSYCDITDFIPVEEARRLLPDYDEVRLRAIAKADSPERRLSVEPPPEAIISPGFNPPGRLCLFRTRPLLETGFQTDANQHFSLLERGWHTGISTAVRHRHMSLLHVYDEPSYDSSGRAAWFAEYDTHARPAPVKRRTRAAAQLAALSRHLRRAPE
jgi:hypothetical protein